MISSHVCVLWGHLNMQMVIQQPREQVLSLMDCLSHLSTQSRAICCPGSLLATNTPAATTNPPNRLSQSPWGAVQSVLGQI